MSLPLRLVLRFYSYPSGSTPSLQVMFDSPYADLPLDHPCVEEYIEINESIDKVFIDDPECIVRISPSSTLKLFTYRTPILYKGARDPNFSGAFYFLLYEIIVY